MEGTDGSRITDRTPVVAVGDQLTTQLDDEKIVLQTETGTYYGIEGVGARVWDLLQQPHTVEQLHRTLVDEYDVDPERCRRDIETFVAELVDRELVERIPESDDAT